MLQDIIRSREVLWMLVWRELRSRYAGSSMGAFWNLVHPIVLVAIYVIIFSQVMAARMGTGGSRFLYTIHLTSALVPWLMFSEIVSRSCGTLVENAPLLRKLSIPGEVFFLSVFVTSLVVHGISMTALIGLLWLFGADITWHVVMAFPVMLALGLTALGIGMVLSVMNLLVRDVGQVVQIGLQLAFWSLPIVYLPSILPDRVQDLIGLNPLKGFFSLIQLLFGSPEAGFNHDSYWTILVLPFATMVLGLRFLRTNQPEILDAL